MYLSLHAQIHACSEEEHDFLVKLIKLFNFTNAPLSHNGSALTATVGEFMLSDLYPPLLTESSMQISESADPAPNVGAATVDYNEVGSD